MNILYIYIYMCAYVCIYIYVYVYTYACTHTYVRISRHVVLCFCCFGSCYYNLSYKVFFSALCICVYLCVFMFVCVCEAHSSSSQFHPYSCCDVQTSLLGHTHAVFTYITLTYLCCFYVVLTCVEHVLH